MSLRVSDESVLKTLTSSVAKVQRRISDNDLEPRQKHWNLCYQISSNLKVLSCT
jgi:hypothetical protein